MNGKKKILALSMAAMMLFVTACGNGGKNTDASNSGNVNSSGESAQTQDGGKQYLNSLLNAEPATLDAQKGSDLYGNTVINNITEPLLRMAEKDDGSNELIPAAAESYEVSEDGLTYTFKLREGMKWEDGQPLTAKDFEYGIRRVADPATGSESAFLLAPIKNFNKINSSKGEVNLDELGVKAVDDSTLEVTLEAPTVYFPTLVPFRVMLPARADIIEKYGEKYGSEADTVLSCGPFKLVEWTHNSRLTLEKNNEYWDAENVKLETVNLPIMTDTNTVMNSFSVGEVDVVRTNIPEWVTKFEGMDEVKFKKVDLPSIDYLSVNHKDDLMKNEKIRTAINLAVDREGLAKTLSEGFVVPSQGWTPNGIQLDGKEYRKEIGDSFKDLKEANKDLKALFIEGMKELGLGEDPASLDITIIYTNSPRVKMINEFVQQSINTKLGTNVKLETMEWPILSGRVQKGDYQLAYLAWTADYNDPSAMLSLFTSAAAAVNTGWESADYDKIITEASQEKDSQKAMELYKEADKMIVDESVVIPLIGASTNQYHYDFVKGIKYSEFTTTGYKTIDTSERQK
ncbi:peptide ABC transporter substrate-binding protein [Lagierella sp.]|uniref:peptide ABC transporter substrate-binding protein n=1 Tax=Lagierella sp. TaxID=2849657 RepID=UPI00261314E1|nr:peptide ABC transporter substrate-binding protein [Lagierella sp.]